MTETKAARERAPTHPGALLREDILPAMGVSISKAAKDLGISRQNLHRILREEGPITPEMALRLGSYCRNGPDLWIRMQNAYDLWRLKQDLEEDLKEIENSSPVAA